METKVEQAASCPHCGREMIRETARLGGKELVNYLPQCSCAELLLQRREEEERRRRARSLLEKLKRQVGPLLWNTLEDFQVVESNRAAYEAARSWSEERGAHGLLLLGNVGCGKTHLAVGAARAMIERRARPATFVSVTPFLAHMRGLYPSERHEALASICTFPIVILDDLGISSVEDYYAYEEMLYEVIDYRYRHDKYTLLTANLKGDREKQKRLGERIADRLDDRRWCTTALIETKESYRNKL